ncbi:MAG: hypothetical protein WBM83_10555 [Flavobacteriaceae bacterium]
MKTKITLFLFVGFLLASCSKWYGHGNNDDIEPTEKNTIYEGYMYYTHLTEKMSSLESRILVLKDIIGNNQGTEQDKEELKKSEGELLVTDAERSKIVDVNSLLGLKIGPIPPCPKSECLFPPELRYLISEKGVLINFYILDQNQNQINKVINSGSVPKFRNQFDYEEFEISQPVKESVIIQVERLDSNGKLISYALLAEFEK